MIKINSKYLNLTKFCKYKKLYNISLYINHTYINSVYGKSSFINNNCNRSIKICVTTDTFLHPLKGSKKESLKRFPCVSNETNSKGTTKNVPLKTVVIVYLINVILQKLIRINFTKMINCLTLINKNFTQPNYSRYFEFAKLLSIKKKILYIYHHTLIYGVNGKLSPSINLNIYNEHEVMLNCPIQRLKKIPVIFPKYGVTVKTSLYNNHSVRPYNTLVTSYKEIYKIQRRFHSGNAIVNNLTKKMISPQILLEQRNILKNKAIFLRYCEHFKNKTLSDLLNDKIFIQEMHNRIHGEPTLFSRAFQLALEVTYSKRRFNEQVLKDMYKNDFLVEDTFNVNKGLCDQSTVYTAILTKKVCFYFNLDVKDIVVNSTPIFLTKEKIIQTMKTSMDYNKKMTNNSCPDLTIKGRPYDFKEPKDISFAKNQVYFIDIEMLNAKGVRIFENLQYSLENSLTNPQSSLAKTYTRDLIKFLQNQKEQHMFIEKRLETLNSFLIKHTPPNDFKLPIIIPTKKASIETLDTTNVDQVLLDPGFLNQTKAKKAIMGVLNTFDNGLKSNVQEITHGSIQFTLPKIEEVD